MSDQKRGHPSPNQLAAFVSGLPAELANHARYRILGLLGVGGMGAVYKAEHRVMQRMVAIKVINRNLMQQAASVERFQREVKGAAKLSHPNIVTAYDAEQAGNVHFLVMEFVEGVSLARQVKMRGPMSIVHACHFIRQAALGLQHAHELGMVHRDIKPHNLMLTRKGQVKILDFGLARFARESTPAAELTQEDAVVGTPDYIAPEQSLQPQNADIRADIYSLGCTMYFILTGQPPFLTGTCMQTLMAHAESMPPPVNELRPEVPKDLAAVVERMMAKNPANRYQTPAEVAQALAPFIRKSGVSADEPPPGLPGSAAEPVRSGRRWMLVAAAGLLLAVCLSAGGVWLYGILTATGEVSFDSVDPGVEIVLLKNGQESARLDSKSKEPVKVRTGAYDVSLKEGLSGWRFEPPQFTLERDGQIAIKSVPVGTVTIDSKVPDATVTIKRGDTVLHKATAERQIELDSGDQKYEIELAEPRDGLQLKAADGKLLGMKAGPFILKRGEQVAYRIVPVGALAVGSRFPGVELKIKQDGKVVHEHIPGRNLIELEAGAYQIELARAREGIRPSTNEITIARGKQEKVDVVSNLVQLFNGQNKKGWRPFPADKAEWKVTTDGKNSVLEGSGGDGHLMTERGDYENFYLCAEFKINEGGNSGLFFRTKNEYFKPMAGKSRPYGYEAQICHKHPDGQNTGSLMCHGPTEQKDLQNVDSVVPGKPDETWVTEEVIADGNHIIIKVNGKTVVDLQEKAYSTGHLALQVFGADTVVKFRKIEVKELPSASR